MIDGIVVFDRSVDPVTPFCTQFSYQGQIDEFFNMEFNKIQVDHEIIGNDPEEELKKGKKKTRIYMTPDDKVFETIKDYTLDDARHNVSDSMRKFKELTKELETNKDRDLLAKAAKEKKYMKKYKEHLMLAMHVQSNLQKPTNFKLFEYEQVSLTIFNKFRTVLWEMLLQKRFLQF